MIKKLSPKQEIFKKRSWGLAARLERPRIKIKNRKRKKGGNKGRFQFVS